MWSLYAQFAAKWKKRLIEWIRRNIHAYSSSVVVCTHNSTPTLFLCKLLSASAFHGCHVSRGENSTSAVLLGSFIKGYTTSTGNEFPWNNEIWLISCMDLSWEIANNKMLLLWPGVQKHAWLALFKCKEHLWAMQYDSTEVNWSKSTLLAFSLIEQQLTAND